jgi:tetratricopeptide (TPR) repeat protein
VNLSHYTAWGQKGFEDSVIKVIKVYTKSIELNPKNDNAYLKRGYCKYLLEDSKLYRKVSIGAIEDYNKAIKINPKNDTAYNIRGHYKFMVNNDSGAIKDYNKAIELNPYYVEAYNNRGLYYYSSLKNNERAIEDFSKAIELDTKNEDAYYWRGYAKFFLGGYIGAAGGAYSDWQRAVELGCTSCKELIEKNCK